MMPDSSRGAPASGESPTTNGFQSLTPCTSDMSRPKNPRPPASAELSPKDFARLKIRGLVEKFKAIEADCVRAGSTYNETQARADFIGPMFEALGWDVDNTKGLPQDLREVVHEDSVDVPDEGFSRKPDYAFRLARQRKFFVEAKKPCVKIESDRKSAFQLRRYGFSAGLPISVLTNFHHLAIYDCVPVANPSDDTQIARVCLYECGEFDRNFDEIYAALSFESVASGRFDSQFNVDGTREGTAQFDGYFLDQVQSWREHLALDIYSRNEGITAPELTIFVQRILNRLIFLRICEDRELEKYETLKKLGSVGVYDGLIEVLRQADKKYDSGLFDLLHDPTTGLKVGDETLAHIIDELYYPRSPYTFSVVEANVLGDIYELFLGTEIQVDKHGKIQIALKPEVRASGGVIPTPKFIVDAIVERALQPKLNSARGAIGAKVADIACGSGVFLLAAFEQLMSHHIEVYAKIKGSEGKTIYRGPNGTWRLTLQEKHRILLNYIYGVDIDSQAVEVARFSLLLKLIEGETNESIAALRSNHGQRALPRLDGTIKCGNSLVDHQHLRKHIDSPSVELLSKVNPFDWNSEFEAVMQGGGFDVILGNPPYVRIQNMVEYSPEEAGFYQSEASGYVCGKTDNFDKYTLFVERALGLIRKDGGVGYIVPHKFFTIKSGECLRGLISKGNHLDGIVHFGVNQVFGRRVQTYTCILLLSKRPHPKFSVENVADLVTWRYGVRGRVTEFDAASVSSDAWELIPPGATTLFERLRKSHKRTLGELAEIYVGLQTSADKIFIVRPTRMTNSKVTFVDPEGREWSIEREILKPCLLDVPLQAFESPSPNAYMIFPYKVQGDRAELFTQAEVREQFPRTWDYLRVHKKRLSKRSIQNGTPQTWYRFGRSQSLTKLVGEKLILPSLSREPRYVFDDQDIVVTGGGNGPYYLIRARDGVPLSLKYLQAVLCHPVIEAMVRAVSSPFQGGYYSHGKQFIEGLPIPLVDLSKPVEKARHDRVVALVEELEAAGVALKRASIPRVREVLARQRRALREELDKLVGRLLGVDDRDLETAQAVQVSARQ